MASIQRFLFMYWCIQCSTVTQCWQHRTRNQNRTWCE